MIEEYREIWNKIKYLVTQEDKDAYYVATIYTNVKSNSDDDLPLNRLLVLSNVVTLFKSAVDGGDLLRIQ